MTTFDHLLTFDLAGMADCALALGFEKMERGSLSTKYDDRTLPLQKHAEAMIEKGGFAPAPMAAQFFGNAGKEHMEKYGSEQRHFTKIAAKNKVEFHGILKFLEIQPTDKSI